MALDVTEHRIAGTPEGEKAHGRRNAEIDTDHGRFDPVFELPGRSAMRSAARAAA
jgi:hypothetical protein